jgi:hypothetical protein
MGLCYCSDCRKASGSGFIPFMGFPASRLRIEGETRQSRVRRGEEARPSGTICARCDSLVFGGIVALDDSHTIYAGSLDDPSLFSPTMAIFVKDRAPWAALPEGLQCFDTLPG